MSVLMTALHTCRMIGTSAILRRNAGSGNLKRLDLHLLPKCRNASSQPAKKTTLRELQHNRTDVRAMGYILLVIPVAAFALGTWQVRRRKWKLSVIEELEKRTTAAPVPLPQDLNELEDLEYRKVIVRGRFDHSNELHILPRTLVEGSEPDSTGDQNVKRRFPDTSRTSGANVVTAFIVDSEQHPNLRILVNRGWVSRDKLKPETRLDGQVEGPIELVGVVRRTEKRQQFAARNNPRLNHWFNRDIDSMSSVLKTAPVFIDADKSSTVPGGPIGGQTIVTLRNEHLSYIFTWYTLSALTFAMWYRAYWR